jgi:hypothetical protein
MLSNTTELLKDESVKFCTHYYLQKDSGISIEDAFLIMEVK